MFEKKFKIKHNNYMKKWLKSAALVIAGAIILNNAVFFTTTNATSDTSAQDINQVTSEEYEKFQECLRQETQADPRVGEAHLKEICKARTMPTDCSLEGLWGWVMCPFISLVGQTADASFFFIKGLLDIDVKFFDTSSPTYTVWVQFRNIANIGLVIAFLAIIISQLTGFGISNYGIKKLFPKLIAAAILVNSSYFVSQIMIDLSNIIGSSFVDFFELLKMDGFSSEGATAGNAISGISIILLAIMTIKLGPTIVTSLYSIVLPMVISYILMLVTTGLILLVRQTAAIILVVASPIAFLAILFPNTENLFKLWKKAFTGILIMFPIIAALFGAGDFVSKIIVSSSNSLLTQVLGMITAAMPLIFTPTLVRNSIQALPMVGGLINQKLNSLRSSGVNKAKNSRSVQLSRKRLNDSIDNFHQGKTQGKVLGRASRATNWLNSRTKSGQARLHEINSRQSDSIAKMSDYIADQDLDKVLGAAQSSDFAGVFESLSQDSQRAIIASGYSADNTAEIASAAMLKKAKAGELEMKDFNAVMNHNEKTGVNSLALNRMAEQTRQHSVNSGRFDMAGYVRGLQKEAGGVNATNIANFTSNPNLTNKAIGDYLKTLSAEDIAKFNPDALASGGAGARVLYDLYNSDPNVKLTVNSSFSDPAMAIATQKAIQEAIK